MMVQTGQRPVRYIQKNCVEGTQLEDEWILLNLNLHTVTKVNEAGGFFWSLLHEAKTADSLLQAIVTEYGPDLSRDIVKQDIEDFLEKLFGYGLIEYVRY